MHTSFHPPCLANPSFPVPWLSQGLYCLMSSLTTRSAYSSAHPFLCHIFLFLHTFSSEGCDSLGPFYRCMLSAKSSFFKVLDLCQKCIQSGERQSQIGNYQYLSLSATRQHCPPSAHRLPEEQTCPESATHSQNSAMCLPS